ncbi:tRNA(fMet)-specific endonuclease VapC [bacterium HR08]|nr:tRNA(fMet)-specific endonuclease VapC [bacterium HR08]
MKYLVDTNVWLELLLDRERAESVRAFLDHHAGHDLALTEFSLYPIGLILTRLDKGVLFAEFIHDVFLNAGVRRLVLDAEHLSRIPAVMSQFHLDFDDAYQYVAAEAHDLVLVSFDADFDRTERGRSTPEQVVKRPSEEA